MKLNSHFQIVPWCLTLIVFAFSATMLEAQVTKLSAAKTTTTFGVAGSKALFYGTQGTRVHIGLYATDGTAEGTKLLRDFFPARGDFDSNFADAPAVDSKQLFIARKDSKTPYGFWSSDGSARNTKEFYPRVSGNTSFSSENFINLSGKAFFTWVKKRKYELWETNATKAGTKLVTQLPGPTNPQFSKFFTPTKNGVVFYQSANTHEIWVSDGTAEGTKQLSDFSELSTSYSNIAVYPFFGYIGRIIEPAGDSQALFSVSAQNISSGQPQVFTYLTDGSRAGTLQISVDGSSGNLFPVQFAADGERNLGYLIADLAATSSPSICSLYLVDLTSHRLTPYTYSPPGESDLFADCRIQFARIINSVLFFERTTASAHELWRTDGGIGTTRMVATFPTNSFGNYFESADVNGRLIFSVLEDGSLTTLWESDGSTAGTKQFLLNGTPFSVGEFDPSAIVNGKLLVHGRKNLLPYSVAPTVNAVERVAIP